MFAPRALWAVRLAGLLVGVFACLSAVSALTAQDLAFQAASLKANASGDLRSGAQALPGGRFRATNVTARTLVGFAFERMPFEIDGGPSWMTSRRFDVEATAGRDASLAEIRLMLQALLRERFQLRLRQEQREVGLYALTLARADRRLGPGLRQSSADCSRAGTPGLLAPPPAPGAQPPECGYFGPAPGQAIRGAGVALRGVTMPVFARALAGMVRRGVIDRTALAGWWDAELEPTAELPPPPPPPGIPDAIDRANLPSIFSVLRDRLGLKLDAIRGPLDVLVIEAATTLADNP